MAQFLMFANTPMAKVIYFLNNQYRDKWSFDKREKGKPLVLTSSFRQAKKLYQQKPSKNKIYLVYCSMVELAFVEDPVLLDGVVPASAVCEVPKQPSFDFFALHTAFKKRKKWKENKIRFLKKPQEALLNHFTYLDLISMCQSLIYSSAPKTKRRAMKKAILDWLHDPFQDLTSFMKGKGFRVSEEIETRFKKWQEARTHLNHADRPNYPKLLESLKGISKDKIPDLAAKHKVDSFDAFTFWLWMEE